MFSGQIIKVSILVLLDFVLKAGIVEIKHRLRAVSILVLLDFVLKAILLISI